MGGGLVGWLAGWLEMFLLCKRTADLVNLLFFVCLILSGFALFSLLLLLLFLDFYTLSDDEIWQEGSARETERRECELQSPSCLTN